jgi:GntR family transcriptional repressor for pyruvate dehydrogenase complex
VEVRHGDGSYIRQVDLREALMVRRRLEPLAAELAAQRRDEGDLDRLRSLLVALKTSLEDPDGFAELDSEIHEAVATASHNVVLIETLVQLAELLALSRATTSRVTAVRRHTLREMEVLVRAIERRRAADASRAMDRHLRRIADALGEG